MTFDVFLMQIQSVKVTRPLFLHVKMSTLLPFRAVTIRRLARQLTWRALLGLTVLAGVGAGAALLAAGIVWVALCGDAALEQQAALWCAAAAFGGVSVRATCWLAAVGPRAQGFHVPRDETPALYQLTDALASRMGAKPVDAVHIAADMNASVHQRPRWGAFGPMRTTLVIGLPLAHSVAPAS